MALLLVDFLLMLFITVNNGVMCLDIGNRGGDMKEEELFGLFEVMGSLLEDPTWAQMHPSPCTETPWPGVECELLEQTSSFHVTKIHVGPDVVSPPCKPSAKIPEMPLLKLPYLKTLSLMNCFTTSPLSLTKSLFENLSFLEHLTIESNPSLTGQIPTTVSNLKNLKILSLSQNNLSGPIPEEIGALDNLQQLDLSHNNLTGPIPQGIGGLSNLAILDLSSNSLQETVPYSIGGLQFVEKIDLSSNKLTGPLPNEFGRLRMLVLLDLSRNSFAGPLPESLSELQQLQYLIMDDNPLNSSVPPFLGSLLKLTVVGFSGCGLTGPIPTTFSNLVNLTALSLDNNCLNGTVPPALGTLPCLDMLNLSRNQLSGELLFPNDFLNRLGERLDIRENKGLFLQDNPVCSSDMFPGPRNKTLSGQDPGRVEKMKPKAVYEEGEKSSNVGRDSGKKEVAVVLLFTTCSVFLFLLFGS